MIQEQVEVLLILFANCGRLHLNILRLALLSEKRDFLRGLLGSGVVVAELLGQLLEGSHGFLNARHELSHDLCVNLGLLVKNDLVEPDLPLREEEVQSILVVESLLARSRQVPTVLLLEGKTEQLLKLLLGELDGGDQVFSYLNLVDLKQGIELCQEDLDRGDDVG